MMTQVPLLTIIRLPIAMPTTIVGRCKLVDQRELALLKQLPRKIFRQGLQSILVALKYLIKFLCLQAYREGAYERV